MFAMGGKVCYNICMSVLQKEQRRLYMRRKVMPFIVAIAFVLVIGLIAAGTMIVQKYTPGKEPSDLKAYYHLAQEDDVAIVLNRAITGKVCKSMDGHAYLTYEFVHNMLNERFYWDSNENILRYVTPEGIVSVNAGSSQYTVGKDMKQEPYAIVKVDANVMYLAVDFVQKYTNIDFSFHEDPNRLLIVSEWGAVQKASLKKATQIREKGGIKSPIVAELEKGAVVTIIDQAEDWTKVITEDGMIGYLKGKTLGEAREEMVSREFQEPVFTHLRKEGKINMAWHQVTSKEANSQVVNMLQGTKGINVLSPTWFYLNDNNGGLQSLASSSYVNYCHQNGIEVWALVSNLENEEVDSTYVLTHTSTRDYLTNQIIAAAIEYGLDGINLDFEELGVEVGDAYIQFIRELSLKCRNNGVTLSVDNYVPSEYTSFYNRREQAVFADYLVIMGYDEHYGGSEEAGSVSSIGFVTKGVDDTLAEAPAGQVILGMPFYTRLWECTPKENVSDSERAAEGFIPYNVTSSTALGMSEAEKRLSANGVTPAWSEADGQLYGEYQQGEVTYRIWLENDASMELRLALMKERGLAGASFWKLGLEKSSIWDTIIKYIN